MIGVLIGVGVWMVIAIIVAIAIGRVARRADAEELGSEEVWDTGEIDVHVQHDI